MSAGWPHDPPIRQWAPPHDRSVRDGQPWHGERPRTSPEFSADDVMTVAEAADLLGCSTRHVYNLVHRDEFPGARYLGRSIVIVRPVLVAWLLGQSNEASS